MKTTTTWALALCAGMTAAAVGTLAGQSLEAAVAAFEEGRFAEAEAALERLVDGPNEVTARTYLGRIHMGRDEYDDAEDHLERAVELAPHDADVLYWLGSSYMDHIDHVSLFGKRGMAHKARDTMLRVLELDPDHLDARQALGGYYLHAPGIVGGSRDKAREQARELIQRDPAQGWLFQAEIHEVEEEWDDAARAYDSAADAAPEEPRVLYAAGMFHQGRERWSEALELLRAAAWLEVTPENRPWVRASLYQVGRTGVLSGEDVDGSIAALRAFVERFPQREDALSAGAHWRLGMLYEMKNDDQAAQAAYRAALEVEPDHEEARKALRRLAG